MPTDSEKILEVFDQVDQTIGHHGANLTSLKELSKELPEGYSIAIGLIAMRRPHGIAA